MFKYIQHKIGLFTRKRKEPYLSFSKMLGYTPRNIELYQQACLHRSSSVRTQEGEWINNERLEFLGDAILDGIVADLLYHRFEGKKEGFLTSTRSKIVQREMLNKLAVQIGLDKLIVSATRNQAHNSYMYGNAFEALIGAIYIDQGYEVCQKFIVTRVITPHIDLVEIARTEVNFKSKLIEWGQKNKVKMEFNLTSTTVDDANNPLFHTEVLLAGVLAGTGKGYTKKESHQNAAQMGLTKIQNDITFKRRVLKYSAEHREKERKSKEQPTPTEATTTPPTA